MAEASESLNILVSGGAESAGLATVRALLRRGHKVLATATDAAGALAIRQIGALPVYPDLSRPSEVLSVLQMAKADVLVHAAPQDLGGAPQADIDHALRAERVLDATRAVMAAAAEHGVKRVISLSFAYLYDSSQGAASEGDHDIHDDQYAPMLAAEAALLNSDLNGFVIRAGYIYGGNSSSTTALANLIKQSRRLPGGVQEASWIHEDDLGAAIAILVEAEGSEIINVAGNRAYSPNAFASALSQSMGLGEDPRFAPAGFFSRLRQKSLRDKLLEREVVIDSSRMRENFGWQPAHDSIESGMNATALVWRMGEAAAADDFYNVYDDKATEAIAAMESGLALPAVVVPEKAPPAEDVAAPKPTPTKADPPPSSDGPTPWSEDEAKREERRRKALERKAKRAAKSGGG